MPPKRAADAATAEEAKRYKSAIEAMADEFCCPITQELPLEPVTAEDGRIYEKDAIEAWVRRAGLELKSPVTNERMGPKLLPAVQAKNTIRSMVKSGAISGDKAEAWKKRIADEEHVVETRQFAEQGNADAMRCMGSYFRDGVHGLAKDSKRAFEWFEKAADFDDPAATTAAAQMLLEGGGIAQDVPAGLVLLGRAIALGSQHAHYLLGRYHQFGSHGLKRDTQAARKWYVKFGTAPSGDASHTTQEIVAAWLRENK
jgi:TPR repeat protein